MVKKKYLRYFETRDEYRRFIDSNDALLPNVSICGDEENEIHYNKLTNALRFSAIDVSEISLNVKGEISPNFEISHDGIYWEEWTGESVTLSNEDTLFVRGNNPDGLNTSSNDFVSFSIKGKVKCSGNVMNLLGKETNEVPCDFCFYGLFSGCTGLVNTPEIPAEILKNHCYAHMFEGCTSLTEATILPALDLKVDCNNCYAYMFAGCTSLETVDEYMLKGVRITTGVYLGMFSGCTSLVKAPRLDASKLSPNCYSSMFEGCTSLAEAPELRSFALAQFCYSSMFAGCTSLEKAPVLPAPGFDIGSYNNMFKGCSSLNYIKALFVTEPGEICTWNWVEGVAEEGSFVKSAEATWELTGPNGIPEGWTVGKN